MSTTEQTTLLGGPTEKPKADSKRSYIVLESTGTSMWKEIAIVEATSEAAAKKSLGQQRLKSEAKYVAIPSRSWNPSSPKIATKTVISFE